MPSQHTAAVLVVDDDDAIRTALCDLLEFEGYVVYEAPDGAPALQRLRTHPDGMVVLLDVRMPGVDGIQVMEAVAADEMLATRHAFIAMTANENRTLPLAFVNTLTKLRVPILTKPFGHITTVLDTVAQATLRLPQ
jgi:CheY-like chemotaxis protein